MSFVTARTGRQRQRYEDNMRLVSGCIPYRMKKGKVDKNEDTQEMIEVLMVSSPKRDDLVFPKGGWEDDETVTEAACREALEEAGVKGIVREIPLGRWDFRSKSSKDSCSQEGWCRGYMFSLEVTEELEAWPEQKDHNRQWVNIKEAFRLSRYDWMCKALEVFISVMAEDIKLRNEEDNVDSSSISVLHVSESQYVSSKCYKRTTSKQHHSISSRTNILSHASQEIAIHLGY
ncbi:nudix hydrolase 12, mitochondrial [Vigna radiata var. radiata]|uniref:Nudix hydrolase 12, mitochondrial n=1 Tax=Vigna radiata var. radiata TaxID=3916 RepID=A0A1S3UTI6_VIGRR|nr:nudix hydrolase 12, mitochondrial [Vigna radiata var. radiata]